MNGSFHIVIFGIGAMACLFGARLSRLINGPDAHPVAVTLVGNWPAQIHALRSAGLIVKNMDGTVERVALAVTNAPETLPPADLALILVKSWQTTQIAPAVGKILRPDGLALTLQNGLGNAEALATALRPQQIAVGITAQGANLPVTGQLHIGGSGHTILARKKGAETALERVQEIFNQAGIPTEICEQAEALIWQKLAVNAAINPLTALLNVPNGRLLELPALLETMRSVVQEVATVAGAQGLSVDFEATWQRTIAVCRATASNISSMLQDIRNGRPTEIDAICGAVGQLAEHFGLPAPVNRLLWQAVHTRQQTLGKSPIKFRE